MQDVQFGFQAAAADVAGVPDQQLYCDLMADCALGRRYYPPYFALQADHHEADADPWVGIPEYADFSRMFANLRKMTNPTELGPFLDSNLVGSFETICRRIDTLMSLGFNYFMVSCATPGTPLAVRQKMMTRFAEEICPRYSSAMRKGRAA